MDPRAIQLEELRQEAETFEYWIGYYADYLDRGHPDDAERRDAAASMAASQQQAGAARRKLIALLAETRASAPEAVAEWVAWHVAHCRAIIAEGVPRERDESGYITDQAVRVHCAVEALTAWEAVGGGSDNAVIINGAYLRDYQLAMSAELERERRDRD